MRAKKLILCMLVIAIFSWLSHAESSAIEAYMKITGQNTGDFPGTATLPGYEAWLAVAAFGHNLYHPVDPQTGDVTGSRRHDPIRIVKAVDESSPIFYSALISGDILTVEIRFLRTDNTGQLLHFFTVSLQGARIMSISPSLIPLNQDNQDNPMMEIVNFNYGQILWKEELGSTEAQDSWNVPYQ